MKNKITNWFENIFKEDKTDEIKGCVDIILKNHTTEQSLFILNNVNDIIKETLLKRMENNESENEIIFNNYK